MYKFSYYDSDNAKFVLQYVYNLCDIDLFFLCLFFNFFSYVHYVCCFGFRLVLVCFCFILFYFFFSIYIVVHMYIFVCTLICISVCMYICAFIFCFFLVFFFFCSCNFYENKNLFFLHEIKINIVPHMPH